MKILEYTFQHRNDFSAIIECEHCQHQEELKGGYHDTYYHNTVLPARKCSSCGQSRTPVERYKTQL